MKLPDLRSTEATGLLGPVKEETRGAGARRESDFFVVPILLRSNVVGSFLGFAHLKRRRFS